MRRSGLSELHPCWRAEPDPYLGCTPAPIHDRGPVSDTIDMTDSKALYKEAYRLHYEERDLSGAYGFYQQVVEMHPDTPEATYARTQLENLAKEAGLDPDEAAQANVHARLSEAETREQKRAEHLNRSIHVTTAPFLHGWDIVETIDIVAAERAFGMNLFRDLFASVRDAVGGQSVATQKVLRDARRDCLTDLRREARELGADAVIAVTLDYSEFSGGGKSMLFLAAAGTAVRIRKTELDEDAFTAGGQG